jgi:hypothetical protein
MISRREGRKKGGSGFKFHLNSQIVSATLESYMIYVTL